MSGPSASQISSAQADLSAASQRASTARAAVPTLQGAVDNYQDELTTAQGAVTTAQSSADTANAALTTAEGEIAGLQSTADTTAAELETAQTAVTTATTTRDDAQTAFDDATTALEDAKTAKEDADEAVETATTAYEDAQTATKDAETAVTDAETELTDATSAVTEAQSDVTSAEASVVTAQGELETATAAVSTARSGVTTAEGKVRSAEGEVSAAERRVAAARARLAKNPDDAAAKAELSAAQRALSSAKGKLSSAQSELTAARTALRQAEENERRAREALAQAQREAEEARERLREAERRKKEAEEALKAAQEALKAAQEAEAEALAALEEAKVAAEEAATALTEAETALAEAETALEEAETALTEAEAALEEAEAAAEEAAEALEEAQAELEELQAAAEEAQAELEEAQAQVEEIQSNLDAKQAELEAAQAEVDQAESEVDTASAVLEELQEDKAAAEAAAASAASDAPAEPDPASAEELDKLTPEQREEIVAQQAELATQEQQLRDEAAEQTAAEQAAIAEMTAAERRQAEAETTRQLANDIEDARRAHVEQYPVWIDTYDGTAYLATVTWDGTLELEREEPPVQETPELPPVRRNRRVQISTDNARTDTAIATTVPSGPNDIVETRTETVRSNPAGEMTGGEVSIDRSRTNTDGTWERSRQTERYDGGNPPVLSESEVIDELHAANGDTDRSTNTTAYAADGVTPVTSHSLTENKRDGVSSEREVATTWDEQGVYPTTQTISESGGQQPTVTSTTNFGATGEPETTYITRDPRGGEELPDGQFPSEYVVWDADAPGQIDRRFTSGLTISQEQFETAIATDEPSSESSDETFYETLLEDLYVGGVSLLIRERDPDEIIGHDDPVRWTRENDDRFVSEDLAPVTSSPLTPSSSTPSLFIIPATLANRAAAADLDATAPAPGTPEFEAVLEAQTQYEQDLAAAATDAERQQVQQAYFADAEIWIDQGPTGADAPVVYAAGYSPGLPSSSMFGADRAQDPHALLARTDIEGVDQYGDAATVDSLIRLYVDGSRDAITRVDTAPTPGGGSRTETIGEHTNAAGVRTELDTHVSAQVARIEQGMEPMAVTEVSRSRFDEVTGEPDGEQYQATATTDSQQTTLVERTDQFNDGVLTDTKINETRQSRDWSGSQVDSFIEANEDVIALARANDYSVHDDGTSIVIPPRGSWHTTSETDLDYDAEGNVIHSESTETSRSVQPTQDYDEDGNASDDSNGAKITTVTTERVLEAGGAPVLDEQGQPIVNADVTTNIRSVAFDPDDGVAGGNNSDGHQWREITEVTTNSTVAPDGTTTINWVTPFVSQVLQEGHDDDWVFDEQHMKTRITEDGSFEIVTDDDGRPVTLDDGDTYTNADGEQITLDHDPNRHEEDLDFSDKFEEFMEKYGSKIVMVGTIVAGVALAFTGVGSAAGLALIGVGVGLSSTQLAYTAINYSQGEASGWDLALDAVGVAGFAVAGLQGVRALNAARSATGAGAAMVRPAATAAASGAGATQAVTGGGRALTYTAHAVNAADAAGMVYEGSQAIRAGLNGDWSTAFIMAGAIVAGGGASIAGRHTQVGQNWHANNDFTPPTVTTPGSTSSTTTPTPSTTSGAPTTRVLPDLAAPTRTPLTGDSTGAGGAPSVSSTTTGGGVPSVGPTSQVGGARGDGVDAPTSPSSTADARAAVGALPSRPAEPTMPAFPDTAVANPRANDVDPGSVWGGQPRLDDHVRHIGDYSAARYEAAGLEMPRTSDGRLVVDAETYHARALDYREMAITGRLEDGVTSHPRADGGVMLVNSRTNEIAFINADGTIGSLYPKINVKSRADGTYRANGNQANLLNNFVNKELQSDALVFAARSARANGDGPAMQEALNSLAELNPRRRESIAGEDAAFATTPEAAGADAPRDIRRRTNAQPAAPAPARLEPPVPSNRVIEGQLAASPAAATARPDLFTGDVTIPGDRHGWRANGRTEDGRVRLEQTLNRGARIDDVIALNPQLVARLGGPDAVRANPTLLDGQPLTVRRSDGSMQDGWIVRSHEGGALTLSHTETRTMDVGELIVRRAQTDPSFSARAALLDVLAADPSVLAGRPLRLQRSAFSVAGGRSAHTIDDGWYVTNSTMGPDGRPRLQLTKQYYFEHLPPSLQATTPPHLRRNGAVVPIIRNDVTLNQVVDFNRARIEGHHGQLPNIVVRYATPDGYVVGANRTLENGPATARADQAVVHTTAALDYLYSRYGYVPSGGDLTLVIDAVDAHRNASMQSQGNILRIGQHEGGGGAFDPGVLMHELGHKMVDDYTLGAYDSSHAGSLHEGIADVMAAAWTNDPIIGRVFNGDGNVIRDLRTGADLIGTRQDWDAAYVASMNGPQDAHVGVEAHRGSGVVTNVARQLAGDPMQQHPGDLGWAETGDLFAAALRTSALSTTMDFPSFSDALRIAAAQRYGAASPTYTRLTTILNQSGLIYTPQHGTTISRILPNGSLEPGWRVYGTGPEGAIWAQNAAGETIALWPQDVTTAGGRDVRVDGAGRVIDGRVRWIGPAGDAATTTPSAGAVAPATGVSSSTTAAGASTTPILRFGDDSRRSGGGLLARLRRS